MGIVALGTTPNPLIASTTDGLETTKWGTVVADEETGRTVKPRVWAGGDIVYRQVTPPKLPPVELTPYHRLKHLVDRGHIFSSPLDGASV